MFSAFARVHTLRYSPDGRMVQHPEKIKMNDMSAFLISRQFPNVFPYGSIGAHEVSPYEEGVCVPSFDDLVWENKKHSAPDGLDSVFHEIGHAIDIRVHFDNWQERFTHDHLMLGTSVTADSSGEPIHRDLVERELTASILSYLFYEKTGKPEDAFGYLITPTTLEQAYGVPVMIAGWFEVGYKHKSKTDMAPYKKYYADLAEEVHREYVDKDLVGMWRDICAELHAIRKDLGLKTYEKF